MWATNLQEVNPTAPLRALLVSTILSIALTATLRMFTKDWKRSLLLLSFGLMLFFSYGQVYQWLKGFQVGGFILGRHRYLLIMTIACYLGGILYLYKGQTPTEKLHQYFSLLGIFLWVPVATSTLFHVIPTAIRPKSPPKAQSAEILQWTGQEPRPDIYYIILDGYAREDILRDYYGFDNQPFISFLEGHGFSVIESSRSNYSQTILSLASSMNMNYLQDLDIPLHPGSHNRTPLVDLIHHSEVRRLLERAGYQMVAFETTVDSTSIWEADLYWTANLMYKGLAPFNAFEGQLLQTTMVRALLDLQTLLDQTLQDAVIEPSYEIHRNRILAQLSRMDDPASMHGDFFVFVHILAPHPPFVFKRQGGRIHHQNTMTLKDGMWSPEVDSVEDYRRKYVDQLVYLNGELERAINEILEKSSTQPIIFLQSDHGPASHLNWHNPSLQTFYERHAILNAYLIPPSEKDPLKEATTPVNSFRMVFNSQFGTDYPLLEDRVYFSSWGHPFRFVDITNHRYPGE